MTVLATAGKIIAALLIFGLIVMIHEFGHFIVAKLCKVKVNEFAIGMGPKLFGFGKGETKYTLRLLPIGGFCAMEGEEAESKTPAAIGGAGDAGTTPAAPNGDCSRAFYHKPVWQRMLIVVAGAAMNLVLGFVLILVNNACFLPPNARGEVLYSTTKIHSIGEDSPAYKTGLRAGDQVLSINGKRVITAEYDMVSALQNDEDGVFSMTVRRDGKTVSLDGVTFDIVTDEDGFRYLKYDFVIVGEPRGVWNTVTYTFKTERSMGVMIWRSLGDMITGKYGLNDLSGPVGTVDVIGDAVSGAVTTTDSTEGWRALFMLVALITVNVGLFNLLPLPALDGGRLAFLVFEAIFRKKVPPKFEGLVNLIGLILLLLLMVVITYSDISKLVGA